MWTVACRNVNRAGSRLTTDSQHHIRLTAQSNVEIAETDRISLLNWCNPWIMHLNLSRWWVLYLLHLLWMNSSALVSFFSAALGRKGKKKKTPLIFWLWVFAGMTMWLLSGGEELISCLLFITSENTCCCLCSLRFPLLPLILLNCVLPQLLSFTTSSSSSLASIFYWLNHFLFMLHLLFVSSPHSTLGFSTTILLPLLLSFAPLPPSLSFSLSFSSLSVGVSLSPLSRITSVCVSRLLARGVESSNFTGEPDRCVRLLETFKEFQFPRADCSMNYSLATFGSLVLHSWYSLVYFFFYFTALSTLFCIQISSAIDGEISPELAGKRAKREGLLFFFTVPPLICR